jgi:hypothetical protein
VQSPDSLMPQVTDRHICKNCGNDFGGNYCNRCGQANAHRITMGHVFHDLTHVFLHADRAIFPFISRLIISPGIVAREFIEGKRKIFNPVQYLILVVGFVLFLMVQSHFYESFETYNSARTAKLPGYFQQGLSNFTWFLKNYANIITLATLPIYALFSWLFFKKKGQNYAEHVMLQVFVFDMVNTLNVIVLLLLMPFKSIGLGMAPISIGLIIVCLVITYKQFYSLNWLTAIGKSIAVYIVTYIVHIVIIGAGFMIYLIKIKNSH